MVYIISMLANMCELLLAYSIDLLRSPLTTIFTVSVSKKNNTITRKNLPMVHLAQSCVGSTKSQSVSYV